MRKTITYNLILISKSPSMILVVIDHSRHWGAFVK